MEQKVIENKPKQFVMVFETFDAKQSNVVTKRVARGFDAIVGALQSMKFSESMVVKFEELDADDVTELMK